MKNIYALINRNREEWEDIEDIFRYIVREVIDSNRERDEDLRHLRDQLEGRSMPYGGPWQNSCLLEDPMSREYHIAVLSAIQQVLKRFPYWSLEFIPKDGFEEDVILDSAIEYWLNRQASLGGYGQVIYEMSYIALESRYSVVALDWKHRIRQVRKRILRHKGTGAMIDPDMVSGTDVEDEIQEGLWEPILSIQEEPIWEGVSYRTIDPWDFYLYPLAAFKVEDADFCIERIWMTRNDLIRGIESYGFDRDAVEEIVESSPGGYESTADNVGEGEDKRNEEYECFRVYGRIPYLKGKDLPSYWMEDDFEVMICMPRGIIFYMGYAPYPFRPYILISMLPTPNQMLGSGIVSLLSDLQDEATATFRYAKDILDLTASPMLLVPERQRYIWDKIEVGPGKTIGYRANPNEVQPFQWNMQGFSELMQFHQYLDQRASRISAASAINSMTTSRVMKATQVEFAYSVLQSRLNLVLSNIQEGVKRIGELTYEMLYAHFPPNVKVNSGISGVYIQRSDLSRPYRFISMASIDDLNPDIRRQKDIELATMLRASPYYTALLQQGNMKYEYNLLRRFLVNREIKNPEDYIGPPPIENIGGESGEKIMQEILAGEGNEEALSQMHNVLLRGLKKSNSYG